MANEMLDVYSPGRDLTGRASSAVTGCRFLKITGNRTNGNIAVAHATAAGRACGVSKYDAAAGDKVGVARGKDRVVHVLASGAIAAFAEVEVGAAGVAVTKNAGVAVGYALTGAADATLAEISLY
ncbi:capsid cement protein [Mycolicibacterium komossense]|uniref:DUF2190 family protein n=1 Tax=Mycolicibacterium komossense TaxID=1779 RepID=A0ABT3CMM3_9MYCO|nr:capsid cement protein [Mycolicibacterium komossense]MCV7230674.1 DUF2190 family protein [Mycolicibacterium komossense]